MHVNIGLTWLNMVCEITWTYWHGPIDHCFWHVMPDLSFQKVKCFEICDIYLAFLILCGGAWGLKLPFELVLTSLRRSLARRTAINQSLPRRNGRGVESKLALHLPPKGLVCPEAPGTLIYLQADPSKIILSFWCDFNLLGFISFLRASSRVPFHSAQQYCSIIFLPIFQKYLYFGQVFLWAKVPDKPVEFVFLAPLAVFDVFETSLIVLARRAELLTVCLTLLWSLLIVCWHFIMACNNYLLVSLGTSKKTSPCLYWPQHPEGFIPNIKIFYFT